jgi:hypothetical protein
MPMFEVLKSSLLKVTIGCSLIWHLKTQSLSKMFQNFTKFMLQWTSLFSLNFGAPNIAPKFHAILKWFGYFYFELFVTFINFGD